MRRLRVGQAVALGASLLAIVAAAGGIAGTLAIHNLSDARSALVDNADPALDLFLQGYRVAVDQELGARTYVLTGEEALLRRYRLGVREGRRIGDRLLPLLRRPILRPLYGEFIQVRDAAQRWQREYLLPAIEQTRRAGGARPDAVATVRRGRPLFEALRATLDREIAAIRAVRAEKRRELAAASRTVNRVVVTFAALLVIAGVAVLLLINRGVTAPVGRLARQSRRTADGDFATPIVADGPRDVRALGEDIDAMRARIVAEMQELERRGKDLERSNAELEQFAYVASHDLQEPLRKVASFTQLLQRRYGDQLDEKADQYIDFAVDGAKRMQVLINDLLTFSRVGRLRDDFVAVSLETSLTHALRGLATRIDETGAVITHEPLPVVRGEASLLTLVLQNLIGNAVKFHGPGEPPRVHVGCRTLPDHHELSVHDEGIGIDPEYAERIFIIFQRLHPKDAYEGTGIGLAMCRKVVEYHGGRIWLDTDAPRGSTFRFTLPITAEDPK